MSNELAQNIRRRRRLTDLAEEGRTIRHAASAWLSRGRPSPGLLTVQLRREVREPLGLQSFPWYAFPSGPSNREAHALRLPASTSLTGCRHSIRIGRRTARVRRRSFCPSPPDTGWRL